MGTPIVAKMYLVFNYKSKSGGYEVSTACFAFLTHQLMALAGGKLQLVLEGKVKRTVVKSHSNL